MAIAFDAQSSGVSGAATSITISHTCSGLDRLLVVSCYSLGGNIITGVTYAGTALTQVSKKNSGTGYCYIYYLINPATGANDIIVSQPSYAQLGASAVSYTGCKQSGQPDAFTTGDNTGTSFSLSNTSTVDNCRTFMVAQNADGNVWSAGASTTKRLQGGRIAAFDSNGAKTPAGSVTLQGTMLSSSTNWGIIMSISPSASAGPANLKTVNGLAKASVKTVNGVAIGSIKTFNGLA